MRITLLTQILSWAGMGWAVLCTVKLCFLYVWSRKCPCCCFLSGLYVLFPHQFILWLHHSHVQYS